MQPRRLAPWQLLIRVPFVLVVLLSVGLVSAHAELLFARVTSEPATPVPGEQFVLSVALVDSAGDGVGDLVLVARLFEPGSEIAPTLQELEGEQEDPTLLPILEVPLMAVDDGGVYRGRVEGLPEGTYPLRIVELVNDNPESNASGDLTIGGDQPVDQELILPPVAPGVGAWILWLVGLPLLAGVLVTVLVLTGKDKSAAK